MNKDDETPKIREMKDGKNQPISRRDALKIIGKGVAASSLLLGVGDMLLRGGAAFADGAKGSRARMNGPSGKPVFLNVNTSSPGCPIPADFAGLGFERGTLNPGNNHVPGYMFDPANKQLITLFKNIGVKNMRMGGGSFDDMSLVGSNSDGYTGLDKLFEFVEATGANVIYTLRMLNPANDPRNKHIDNLLPKDAALAEYIWQRYRSYVTSFSIGNEPDWHSYHTSNDRPWNDPAIYETVSGIKGSAYKSYLSDWRKFADAVRKRIPAAKFSGPDTGSYYGYGTFVPDPSSRISWTQQFAQDEAGAGMIADITQHLYVGGSPRGSTARQAIHNMLSAEWANATELGQQPAGTSRQTDYTPYPWIYENVLAPVLKTGLSYRLTESNDYLTGIPGASNAFASALWALDYLHWWAAHKASGVNFHNKQWIWTDTIVMDSTYSNYLTNPKGYAIKAFNIGGNGHVMPIEIDNPHGVNLTAYAAADGHDLFVTIINKTHDDNASDAAITIIPKGIKAAEASVMVMEGDKPGDPSTMNVTLGGDKITNYRAWHGNWTQLEPDQDGMTVLNVKAATAAVVRIRNAGRAIGGR